MAVSYASPGVYVEEVDRGTKPIQAVGTSVAAFVGITAEASRKALDPESGERIPIASCLNVPTLVTNWTQFSDIFGGFTTGAFLPDAVYGYFANGGGPCYVVSLRALEEMESEKAKSSRSRSAAKKKEEGGEGEAASAPAAPAAGPLTAVDFIGDVAERTGINGLEALDDVSLILCPDLMAGYDGSNAAKEMVKQVQTAMIAHCENQKYRFAILDTPPGLNAQQVKEWRNQVNFDSAYAAMYYPWIEVADLSDSPQTSKMVPPSGHIVGIYNRTDSERGVHKAPANEVVLGATNLEINLTKGEQDGLNPIGVNCIRSFPGRGIRVWGARTLSSDGSWRYINVRRLFIMVGASLEASMGWVVFEPNDSTLWAKVTRDVTSFLRLVWRSGALFGATPEQAFYVKCDEELNPAEVRDLGQLIIEIGMAPVKPAEFVIFRLSQWAGANAEA
ncbi:MAG: phage tail sheath family protein [Ardenticatenaceae bacterium]|nr:phage tail sheath family protein [Anaerolineales bacterium]MCB8982898.1 phage tail sheath family protein [Ardenticatenaceae bacterium]MCB8986356.1 phage tail sheath family protein [Ardenticatenaceae bacterium]